MEILVVGPQARLEEVKLKLGNENRYAQAHSEIDPGLLRSHEVILDFTIHESLSRISLYEKHDSLVVFLNTSLISLSKLQGEKSSRQFFGFCGLPTFFNRPVLEVSLRKEDQLADLKRTCSRLGTEYQAVADRVGLVTPRVVCMIINEAYCTVMEGTAAREDVDLAMKLGTNYPFGPFEWSERIGIKHVCKLLDAVHHDTRDDRYKVCQLLRDEAGKLSS